MDVAFLFLIVATIVGIGFAGNYIFSKTKIPDILFLLLLGVLLGPVLGVFERELFLNVIPYVSALALLMILFNGGLNLKLDKVIEKVPRGAILAILGFTISTAAVSGVTFIAFESLSFVKSVLLGVIVGGVSSAIVIPVASELEDFRKDAKLMLDIESVITDPLCIIVALAMMGIMAGGASSPGAITTESLSAVVSTFSISIVVGFILGGIWLEVLRHIKGQDFHYMLTISFLFFVYASTQILGGHGAVASFVVGLILGNPKRVGNIFNSDKKYFGLTEKTKEFQDQISFFIKTFFFVILGIIITFENPMLFLYGGILSIVIIITRYVAVEIISIGTELKRMEKSIMTFMSPRGLAAAVLASTPFVEYGIGGTQIFTEIVFSVILGTSLVTTFGTLYVQHKADFKAISEDTKKSSDSEDSELPENLKDSE